MASLQGSLKLLKHYGLLALVHVHSVDFTKSPAAVDASLYWIGFYGRFKELLEYPYRQN